MPFTFETLPMKCPRCGAVLDQATSPNGRGPVVGDISICVECRAVAVFDVEGLREISAAEFAALPPMAHVQIALMQGVAEKAVAEAERLDAELAEVQAKAKAAAS